MLQWVYICATFQADSRVGGTTNSTCTADASLHALLLRKGKPCLLS